MYLLIPRRFLPSSPSVFVPLPRTAHLPRLKIVWSSKVCSPAAVHANSARVWPRQEPSNPTGQSQTCPKGLASFRSEPFSVPGWMFHLNGGFSLDCHKCPSHCFRWPKAVAPQEPCCGQHCLQISDNQIPADRQPTPLKKQQSGLSRSLIFLNLHVIEAAVFLDGFSRFSNLLNLGTNLGISIKPTQSYYFRVMPFVKQFWGKPRIFFRNNQGKS